MGHHFVKILLSSGGSRSFVKSQHEEHHLHAMSNSVLCAAFDRTQRRRGVICLCTKGSRGCLDERNVGLSSLTILLLPMHFSKGSSSGSYWAFGGHRS